MHKRSLVSTSCRNNFYSKLQSSLAIFFNKAIMIVQNKLQHQHLFMFFSKLICEAVSSHTIYIFGAQIWSKTSLDSSEVFACSLVLQDTNESLLLSNRYIWIWGSAYSPEHKVMGVDVFAVLRLPKIPRVAHDSTSPACASLLQWISISRNNLKQFLESSINILRSFLSLQFLVERKITLGY